MSICSEKSFDQIDLSGNFRKHGANGNNVFAIEINNSHNFDNILNIHQYKSANLDNAESAITKNNASVLVSKIPSCIKLRDQESIPELPDSLIMQISGYNRQQRTTKSKPIVGKSKTLPPFPKQQWNNRIVDEGPLRCKDPLAEAEAARCSIILHKMKIQRYRLGVPPVKRIDLLQNDLDKSVQKLKTTRNYMNVSTPPLRSLTPNNESLLCGDDEEPSDKNEAPVIVIKWRQGEETVEQSSQPSQSTDGRTVLANNDNHSRAPEVPLPLHAPHHNSLTNIYTTSKGLVDIKLAMNKSSSMPNLIKRNTDVSKPLKSPPFASDSNLLSNHEFPFNSFNHILGAPEQALLSNNSVTNTESDVNRINPNDIEKYLDDDMRSLFKGTLRGRHDCDKEITSDEDISINSAFGDATIKKRKEKREKMKEDKFKGILITNTKIGKKVEKGTNMDTVNNNLKSEQDKIVFKLDAEYNNDNGNVNGTNFPSTKQNYFKFTRDNLLSKKDKVFNDRHQINDEIEDSITPTNRRLVNNLQGGQHSLSNESGGHALVDNPLMAPMKMESRYREGEEVSLRNVIPGPVSELNDEQNKSIPNFVHTNQEKMISERKISCVECNEISSFWCNECKNVFCVTHWNLVPHHKFIRADEVWENRRPKSCMERFIASPSGLNVYVNGTGASVQGEIENKGKFLSKKIVPPAPLKYPFSVSAASDGNAVNNNGDEDSEKSLKNVRFLADFTNPNNFYRDGNATVQRTALEKDLRSAKNKHLHVPNISNTELNAAQVVDGHRSTLDAIKTHITVREREIRTPMNFTAMHNRSANSKTLVCGQGYLPPRNAKYRNKITKELNPTGVWKGSKYYDSIPSRKFEVFSGVVVAVNADMDTSAISDIMKASLKTASDCESEGDGDKELDRDE